MSRRIKKMKDEKPAVSTKPSVAIDHIVALKIDHWVQKAHGEVSGLGKLERQTDGSFRILDAIMLPQENTQGSTELDANAVSRAMYTLRDAPGDLNWWWHSHGGMDAFWSQTDLDTMEEFAGNGGYCVATVFNHARKKLSALCINTPVMKLLLDDIPTRTVTLLDPKVFEQWDEEFKKNYKDNSFHHTPINRQWTKSENGTWLSTRDDKELTIWESPPWMQEIDQGFCIRYSYIEKGNVKYGLMPDGKVLQKTYKINEAIPLSDYDDDNIAPSQPTRIKRADYYSTKHPALSSDEIDNYLDKRWEDEVGSQV